MRTLPVLATSALLLVTSSLKQSSNQPTQRKQSDTSAPQQTPKVWRNDDLTASKAASPSQPDTHISGDISVISPAEGTIVKPGQVITVQVRVAESKSISHMAVISPLGFGNELRSSPPWNFTLTVPTEDRRVGGGGPLIGKQPIYVVTSGPSKSHPGEPDAYITVDVEEPDGPTRLSTDWNPLSFQSADEIGIPLGVAGTFPDGLLLDVSESTHISYHSTDEKVVTVSDTGFVKPTGPGKAFVYARYGEVGHGVQLAVPVTCWTSPK